jgi:hypothetical protein
MKSCSSQVAIIIDPEFGDRLASLADQQCVWVADSANDRTATERLWREKSAYAVTTFHCDPTASSVEILADILPIIDEHHGALSCTPPYRRLVVYGVEPNAAVLAALTMVGFGLETPIANGFTAIAVSAV